MVSQAAQERLDLGRAQNPQPGQQARIREVLRIESPDALIVDREGKCNDRDVIGIADQTRGFAFLFPVGGPRDHADEFVGQKIESLLHEGFRNLLAVPIVPVLPHLEDAGLRIMKTPGRRRISSRTMPR